MEYVNDGFAAAEASKKRELSQDKSALFFEVFIGTELFGEGIKLKNVPKVHPRPR